MANSKRRRSAVQHAIQRAKERHDVDLSDLDIITLNKQIWDGLAVRFGVQNRAKKRKGKGDRYFVKTPNGTDLPVIYSTSFHSIVTVLASTSAEVVRAKEKARRLCECGQPADPMSVFKACVACHVRRVNGEQAQESRT